MSPEAYDLHFAGVDELGRLLRAGKLSSVELTRQVLDRLAAEGPRYNALAELTPDLASAQAQRADLLLRLGQADSPLVGIPYGAKDLLATKGIPTRWGAPPFRDQVFDSDATVITRLHDAGAVLVAKLSMVELAGGGWYRYASASLHGPGLNPWNRNYWSGGSSSGSGSAVAAGLVPFALGSETWGSIMAPASFCGITGLRPTAGVVSRAGAMQLAWSMDKLGPMAHRARDCGWILQAIAGHDPDDASTVRRKFVFQPLIQRRTFRLGVLPLDYADAPGGAETEKAFAEALHVLHRAGMEVATAQWPNYPLADIARTILGGEIAAAHGEFIRSERLDELVDAGQRDGLRGYLTLTGVEIAQASAQRAKAAQAISQLFERCDALVAPTLVGEAVSIDTNLDSRFGGGHRSTSVLGAVAGVPALSVPMGFGAHGLPLGLSITGNQFDENAILQIGMSYQRETDWHLRRPPALSSSGEKT